MAESNKDLLNLENNHSSSSTLESKLIVCKNNQNPKPKPPDGMPFTSSLPKSQVLGKARDFLGVISEANKRLQHDAKDNAKEYDIEALTGHESEYIEMDLMLGVADLYTPEVVAAAESAIAGRQPVISLADSSSGTGSEDSSDDSGDSVSDSDDDGDHLTCPPTKHKHKRSKPLDDDTSMEPSRNGKSKKRPKIVEL
ncbi:uncharacterized protein LOC130783404 [Actinidia eriantha]|uniref:uncharacterized protein LOC130783404 n=1 Tax=Actinidia eriantha TaxID=165200 RepID=UPI00258C8E7F|nr:uncharacterized protein LOC130783404 [Actinidia eriantha]XP_057498978.1 uncharacterized protein LOC130783404 [Actinidia eriantha]